MSEQDQNSDKPAEQEAPKPQHKPLPKSPDKPRPRKRSAVRILSLLLLLLLCAGAVAGYYGYKFYQQFNDRLQTLAQQQTQTESETADLKAQLGADLQTMSKQQLELGNDIHELQRRSHFLRKDWLVMEAEYLLQLANYRLLFERDTRTALVALKSADNRLREAGDPSLIAVRKAIAESEQALADVPQPDLAGLSLTISALGEDVGNLPLATPDPKSMLEEKKAIGSKTVQAKTWSGFKAEVKQIINHLIRIRDHSKPVEPLLAPDQRFFLMENLRLQLEQARLAMLSGNATVYKERITKAIQWIKQYFDPDASQTVATLATLNKLLNTNIAPSLPDISKPYQMLERYRAQSATSDTKMESKPK